MERDLEGKVAVISGGSRGIGRAIARRFALDGADCVVAARNESALTSAAQELARDSGRRIEICPADLRTLTGCEKVYRTVEERFGVWTSWSTTSEPQKRAAFSTWKMPCGRTGLR